MTRNSSRPIVFLTCSLLTIRIIKVSVVHDSPMTVAMMTRAALLFSSMTRCEPCLSADMSTAQLRQDMECDCLVEHQHISINRS